MARSVISGVDVNGRSCYSVSVAAGTQPHSRGSRADSKVKNELDRTPIMESMATISSFSSFP